MSELDTNLEEEQTQEQTSEQKHVKQLLIEALESLDYPVILQGSLGDEDYPESFFTYWLNESLSDSFYSNKSGETIWYFDLNFYSSLDALEMERIIASAKSLLEDAGFIAKGMGYDVASDESSHTGRGMNLIYIEKL